MLTSIIAAVVILGVLVLVHEAGHFVMAKRCGVRVIRFSIGYPPRLFGFRRGETEYQIGATPFGGYVRMLGDETAEEPGASDLQTYIREIALDLIAAASLVPGLVLDGRDEDAKRYALARRYAAGESAISLFGRELRREEIMLLDQVASSGSVEAAVKELSERHPVALIEAMKVRAFPTQPLYKRLLIVLAGPLSNLLFAPILLTIVFMYGIPRLLPVLGQVKAGMPAQTAGLREGDRVVAIDGKSVTSWEELSNTIRGSKGAPLKIEYERGVGPHLRRNVTVITPKREDEKSAFGDSAPVWIIGVRPRGDATMVRSGPLKAAGQAFVETGRMTVMLVVGIAKIADGSTPVREALGGPIMIAQLAGREAREGFANVMLFTVTLSIELGIINLLPVPILDGGHLLFFVAEGIRGKPLKLRHREIAQQVGLFLLAVLMAFVIFNDIARIVQG